MRRFVEFSALRDRRDALSPGLMECCAAKRLTRKCISVVVTRQVRVVPGDNSSTISVDYSVARLRTAGSLP